MASPTNTASPHTITIRNKKVFDFYAAHPHINIESMNLALVDILEGLTSRVDATATTVDGTVASQLLSGLSDVRGEMARLHETRKHVSADIAAKMADMKQDYVDNIRLIVSNNTTDMLFPLIKQNTDSLVDKTQLLLSSTVDQNKAVPDKIMNMVTQQYAAAVADMRAMCEGVSGGGESTGETLKTMDAKITEGAIRVEAQLSNALQMHGQAMEAKLSAIEKRGDETRVAQSDMQAAIAEFFRKMENSSTKGKMSENLLYGVVHSLYPCAEIDSVGAQKETGDIIMTRAGKPKLLIENKNYGKNVGQDEVKKFIRDVDAQGCCGLFLSQNYGISTKENFEINVHNGNVLVYVHNVNNSPEKIKTAIDIIDHFKARIDELNDAAEAEADDGMVGIPKDTLDEVNREFQQFAVNSFLNPMAR